MIRPPPTSTLFPYTTLFRSLPTWMLCTCAASTREAVSAPSVASRTMSDRSRPWRDQAFAKSVRSEEHTSELQSRRELVCRLLLEKKKKKDNVDVGAGFV